MGQVLEFQRVQKNTQKNTQKNKSLLKGNNLNKEKGMSLNLYEILPEEISDAQASLIADIFMELALAIESHYYTQIRRHLKTFSAAPEEPF
jgi:hypothetical protein